MDESSMTLYQKLAAIRKQVEVLQKDSSGFNYKYVSDEELLPRITAFMEKHDLLLIPKITPGTAKAAPLNFKKTKIAKNGTIYEENVNEIMVQAEMTFDWININDPSDKLSIPWLLVGQQSDASQAFGSGLTYVTRYFLLKFFNVSTVEDDPDSWRSKQKAAIAAEDKMIAGEIVRQMDAAVKTYLAANPKDAEEVKKLVVKYVKSGNYLTVTDPGVAARMFNEFKNTYNNTEE